MSQTTYLSTGNVRIDRVEGDGMAVNSYVVHGPGGLVVVDAQLTVADAHKVRETVRASGLALAGVLVTHPHPDHYAGAAIIASGGEPIMATAGVAAVIRRDDALKDGIVGAMMGAQWPSQRRLPDTLVESGSTVELGGLSFSVRETGPGESDMDSLWTLDDRTVFAGDVAYHDAHAYLADGNIESWRTTLDDLAGALDSSATLYVGHGAPVGPTVLREQRRYLDAFVQAVIESNDLDVAQREAEVVRRMRPLAQDERLLFLMQLSIEPVHAALAAGG
ncbi:MAG: MBL fold metallo-hydrolase [Nocardioidaceae bacterium]|nr:MBL fold metallo-hydrolase [Nocardioidaceae bacterium]